MELDPESPWSDDAARRSTHRSIWGNPPLFPTYGGSGLEQPRLSRRRNRRRRRHRHGACHGALLWLHGARRRARRRPHPEAGDDRGRPQAALEILRSLRRSSRWPMARSSRSRPSRAASARRPMPSAIPAPAARSMAAGRRPGTGFSYTMNQMRIDPEDPRIAPCPEGAAQGDCWRLSARSRNSGVRNGGDHERDTDRDGKRSSVAAGQGSVHSSGTPSPGASDFASKGGERHDGSGACEGGHEPYADRASDRAIFRRDLCALSRCRCTRLRSSRISG